MDNDNQINVIIDEDKLNFECPHCFYFIQVLKSDLNCRIFRHAFIKNNYQQINPHASEKECNDLVESGSVFGCAKPFQIIEIRNSDNDEAYIAKICGYI
jgi:hypothetical protein